MIPDKLIAKLRAEYNPPLPPERVAVHIQKELNDPNGIEVTWED